MQRLIHLAIALLLTSTPTGAQSTDSLFAPPPMSLGQPARWHLNWGLGTLYNFDNDLGAFRLLLNTSTKGLLVPQFGVGAITAELGLDFSGDGFEPSLGAYFSIPWLRAGAEYRFEDEKVSPAFAFETAPFRGGIFRRGDAIRIDYRPVFKELQIGFIFVSPFERYRRSRTLHRYTELPDGRVPYREAGALQALRESERAEIDETFHQITQAMIWLDRLLTPHFRPGRDFDESARGYKEHIDVAGHTFLEEDERYHLLLDKAFTLALDGDRDAGRLLAATAERIIFESILVPYNGLFGQNKKPRTPRGFIEHAAVDFDAALVAFAETEDGRLLDKPERHRAARAVFRHVVATIEDVAEHARKRWRQKHIFWLRQARLVWLPLNYGLRPQQYDTQKEVDEVIAAVTGRRFTDSNLIEYLLNQQFHLELKQMIRETERHHVFVIHDFRGRYGKNSTDTIGWDVVVDGYIRAFINAVDAIDSGTRSRLPQFILYLDENFYQDNKSRQLITYLERLYEPPTLDLENDAIESEVRTAQKMLRTTIAASPAFAGASRAQLQNAFKIHVSITNPYDRIFAADATMRDHRKMAYRDVSEDDPGSGVGVFTGQGVGEHYNGSSWEDRSLLVRGPALLELKAAVRQLHLSQGFTSDEVPECLRKRTLPDDYDKKCEELERRGWTTPLLTVFNETGYGAKKATVLKATLYNLATRERVVFSFDSLWISDFWAGMFISAALRGAHMFPVAPAAENAPSSAMPTMYLMRENLDIMVHSRKFFAAEIAKAGGALNVGLYAHDVPVDDVKKRISVFLDGLEKYSFLQEHLALHPTVIDAMREIHADYDRRQDGLETSGAETFDISSEHKPFLHLKVQFFVSYEGLRIIERKEWGPILKKYIDIRQKQVNGLPNDGITPALLRLPTTDNGGNLLTGFQDQLDALPPDERDSAIFMLTLGSHNQDRRGMLLDGEVLIAVSGVDALTALADLMFIIGTAQWPQNSEELFDLFPKGDTTFITKASRWIKDLI